jgi:hypothetical protein
MKHRTDIVGKKYNSLTVVSYSHTIRTYGVNRPVWDCVCDCGKTAKVQGHCLKSGNTKSCGCMYDKRGRRDDEIMSFIRQHPEGATRSEMSRAFSVHYQHVGRALKAMVNEGRLDKVPVFSEKQDKRTRPLAFIYVLPDWDTGARTGGNYVRIPKPKPTILLDRIMEMKHVAPFANRIIEEEIPNACTQNGWVQTDGKWEYTGLP